MSSFSTFYHISDRILPSGLLVSSPKPSSRTTSKARPQSLHASTLIGKFLRSISHISSSNSSPVMHRYGGAVWDGIGPQCMEKSLTQEIFKGQTSYIHFHLLLRRRFSAITVLLLAQRRIENLAKLQYRSLQKPCDKQAQRREWRISPRQSTLNCRSSFLWLDEAPVSRLCK